MDRLNPLDVTFLNLERDVQQIHVGSALVFEGPAPSFLQLRNAVEAKLPQIPRYRQHIRDVPFGLGRPVWVDDRSFDLSDHVRHATVPAPGGDEQLRLLAGVLMSEHLDLTRPLWETWLVTGLSSGRWALVNKGHHAMIDGISGTDIMSVLLDRSPDVAVPSPMPWTPQPEPSSGELARAAVADVSRSVWGLGRSTLNAVRSPGDPLRHAAAQVYGLARVGEKVVRPEFGLNGPLGPDRSWGWARADLADVKAVKNALGGTVNDVILAAITGGFRELLLSRGESVEGHTVRTMVPVSMRRPGDTQPGNEVSAVFADLPVGLTDPAERLAAVSEQLSGLKGSGMAVGVETLISAAGFLPPTLFALGAQLSTRFPQRTISTVTTNVPGPQHPMYMLGRRMLEMFPYIPLGAEMRITIGIMSYDGHLNCGVTGERDLVPDLQVLCSGIESATSELVALATS